VLAARGPYEATQLLPLAALFVVGVLFYAAGASTRRKMVAVPFEEELAHTVPSGEGAA
jgi:hypothetical protein